LTQCIPEVKKIVQKYRSGDKALFWSDLVSRQIFRKCGLFMGKYKKKKKASVLTLAPT
jgi:hypothetical protein